MKKFIILSISVLCFASEAAAFQPNRGPNTFTVIPRDQDLKMDLADRIPNDVRYPMRTSTQCFTEYREVNPGDYRAAPPLLQGIVRLVNPKRPVYEEVSWCEYYLR